MKRPGRFDKDHEWLKEPFGPFPEHNLLTLAPFKQPRQMSHVELVQGDGEDAEWIGFDDIEYISHAPPGMDTESTIRFLGLIELNMQNKGMLTESGHTALDAEIRDRYRRTHPNAKGTLTLRDLLLSKAPLRVKVLCVKSAPAVYDRLKGVTQLQSVNPDRKHQLWDVTLSVQTLERSQNFRDRYSLLKLLEEILKLDHYRPTPMHERTPEFFIQAYIDTPELNDEERARYQKIIYDPDDKSDMDEDGHTTRPIKPRRITHAEMRGIFLAQSQWLMAEQVEKVKSNRIIDLVSWYDWFIKMRAARRKRWEEKNEIWGWQTDWTEDDFDALKEEEERPDLDMTQFGVRKNFKHEMGRLRKEAATLLLQAPEQTPAAASASSASPTPEIDELLPSDHERPASASSPTRTPSPPSPPVRIRSARGGPRRTQTHPQLPTTQARSSRHISHPPPLPHHSRSLPPPQPPQGQQGSKFKGKAKARAVQNNHDYDLEYSDGSSSEYSDIPDEFTLPLRNPVVEALVPPELYHPPQLPTKGLVWHCPIKDDPPPSAIYNIDSDVGPQRVKCEFEIDFVTITEETMIRRGVEPDVARHVAQWRWAEDTQPLRAKLRHPPPKPVGFLRDACVKKALETMVSNHWEHRHLRDRDLEMVGEDRDRLEWVHPRAHEPVMDAYRNFRQEAREADEDVEMG